MAKHLKRGTIAGAVLIFLGLLFFADPEHSLLYPPCFFQLLTGLYCPGCGSLRSIHQILHGNFRAALSYNPLIGLLIPFLLYLFISHFFWKWRANTAGWIRGEALSIWILLGIIVVFWIFRNLPIYPFSLLAPG